MFLRSKIDNSDITFAIENKQIKCKREVILDMISEVSSCWNYLKPVRLDMVHKHAVLKLA